MHASSPPNARRGRVTPPTLVSMILRTYSAILLPLQCPETFRKHSFQVVKALPSSYRTSNCKDRSSRSYKDWDTQPCPSGFTEVMYSDREQPLLHTCLIFSQFRVNGRCRSSARTVLQLHLLTPPFIRTCRTCHLSVCP